MKKIITAVICVVLTLVLPIYSSAVFLPDEKGIYNSTLEIEKDENKVRDAIEEGKPISDTEESDEETADETNPSILFDREGYTKYVIKPSFIIVVIGVLIFAVSVVVEIIVKNRKKSA